MNAKILNYVEIAKQLKKEHPMLTEFEVLSLAVQMEKKLVLVNDFVANSDDEISFELDALGIDQGYIDDKFQKSITNVLNEMSQRDLELSY